MKQSLYIALAMLVLALPGLFLINACSSAPVSKLDNKAVIVDQLFPLYPNQGFIDKAGGILKDCGFQVDVYRGDEITVDFYRRLPSMGYSIIIFRSHSGLQDGTVHLKTGDATVQRTYLFTNEPYSETAQIYLQLSDRLTRVRVDDNHPWLFGITADFVRHSMQGEFDRSIILMMGCSTLTIHDMASAFVEKGASVYTGWDASVGLDYVDHATLTLLKRLFSDQVLIQAAISDTMQEKGNDPNWGARLKYYPDLSGSKTSTELVKKP